MSEDTPVELKGCPRCGNQPLRRDKTYWTGKSSNIIRVVFTCHCETVRAAGRRSSYTECSGTTEAEAIEEWNCRV